MVWIWPIQKYIVKREIPLSKRIGLKICMQSEKKYSKMTRGQKHTMSVHKFLSKYAKLVGTFFFGLHIFMSKCFYKSNKENKFT